MEHGPRVAAPEPVSPIVTCCGELCLAGAGVNQALGRPDPKVAAVDAGGVACKEGTDLSAAVTIGAVDPVVEAPQQRVHPVLLVAEAEAGIELLCSVGLAIPIGIFGVDDVRCGGDEYTLVPGVYPVGEIEPLEEDSRLVVAAVGIGVLKIDHLSSMPCVPGLSLRVVNHLGNPELAVNSPVKGHRIPYERLCGHQLDAQPRPGAQAPE